MHHTVAWRVSAADATLVDITPVPDSVMAVNNAHFVPQVDNSILYAYAGAATLNRARLSSPSLRQVSTPWIRPQGTALVPLDEPNIADYRANPLTVRGLEELAFEAMQTTGGAAVIVGVAALTREGMGMAPQGQTYTMRGTGGTTVTAGAWSLVTVTWQDTLPAGNYVVTGFEAVGVTCCAARLIFEDSVSRPGCVGQSLVSGNNNPMFRKGGLGAWGRFTGNRMPNVEFLCNAADTAQEMFLDFVRVG